MIRIAIFFVVVLVSGCSGTKKLQRLRIKHPDLFVTDTIKIQDTLFALDTGAKIKDTFHIHQLETMPIELSEGQLNITLTKLTDSTYGIAGSCDTVEIPVYYEVEVPCEKVVEKSGINSVLSLGIKMLLFLFLIALLISVSSRKSK